MQKSDVNVDSQRSNGSMKNVKGWNECASDIRQVYIKYQNNQQENVVFKREK